MPQETTSEFAYRLTQAVDGHPLAPSSSFGRQKWLKDKLEKEADVKVSANTMHKWFNGAARPREDKIRALARILAVDQVWLALGRRPVADKPKLEETAIQSSNATLLLAGFLGVQGSRISFPQEGEEGVSLYVDSGKGQVPILVVAPQVSGQTVTFMIPEPVTAARVLSVGAEGACPNGEGSGRVIVTDLTDIPKKNFGGFSIVSGERRSDGRIKIDGQRNLLAPEPRVADAI